MSHESPLRARSSDRLVDEKFAADVIEGLGRRAKELPCRWLYDARGSELFEEITRLPEYYPTRTEAAILTRHAAEISARTPIGAILVEFGSGSSRKTEIVLQATPQLAAYVPIDVSQSALQRAQARLARRFPALETIPVVGDFLAQPQLPASLRSAPRVGFFPGSTIGNLRPQDACALLKTFARTLGEGARLVVGVDLRKSVDRLLPAYDDSAGVTAAFNANVLRRINRELDGDFDVEAFAHEAVWNEQESRIEMRLVSLRPQLVHVLGHTFGFRRDERIHTENSYKHTVEGFRRMAREAGWRALETWTDDEGLFSVHDLAAAR
ncbi:MAG TPA: L-histidine N(alpha)-methyltransferase [Beijerinckiaceae bacterium]|nr:L-histidine N(alpha)-methyltransferase [Beijerinckiaceae bacterium]